MQVRWVRAVARSLFCFLLFVRGKIIQSFLNKIMTELKDVVHFYIGQNVMRPDGKTILPIFGVEGSLIVHREGDELTYSGITGCKPILRPISEMAYYEMKELHCLWYGLSRDIYEQTFDKIEFGVADLKRHITQGNGVRYSTFKDGKHIQTGTLSFERLNRFQFQYLLKQGFDLFDLIENGVALNHSIICGEEKKKKTKKRMLHNVKG